VSRAHHNNTTMEPLLSAAAAYDNWETWGFLFEAGGREAERSARHINGNSDISFLDRVSRRPWLFQQPSREKIGCFITRAKMVWHGAWSIWTCKTSNNFDYSLYTIQIHSCHTLIGRVEFAFF
jgi:hypothetical protein